MKIENDLISKCLGKASRPAAATGEASFKAHFKQALTTANEATQATSPMTAARPTAIVSFPLHSAPDVPAAVKALDNLLGELEAYQKRLGDGRFSLKMLEKDLNRLNAPCQELDALTQDQAVDENLMPLLKEGLATARMEIERFRRGDYC